MRSIIRSQVPSWLLLAMVVGLFGCPLLLDDDFSIGSLSEADAGNPCIGNTCHNPYSNIGGNTSDAGEGGEEQGGSAGAGAAGGSGSAGNSGTGGAAGSAGTGSAGTGSAGTGSAGTGSGGSSGSGSAGADSSGGSAGAGTEPLACWTLELTDGTHDASSNCLGIHGSNIRVTDTSTTTTLTLSYQDGDPCFTGRIAASGWGATYELDLAGGPASWNANTAGVTGFEFATRGNEQPQSFRAIYKQKDSSSDFCRVIGPGTTSVLFSAAYSGCAASGAVADTSKLDELILAFTPSGGAAYDLEFCVQIRALD